MPTTKTTASAKKTSSKTSPKKEASKKAAPSKATAKATVVSAPRVRIIVKSFDYTVIDEAAKSIVETAERGGSLVSGPVLMPTKIKKYTVNRSFFVNKDARDQYEMRTHKRLIDIKEPTSQTIEALQNLALPAGVDVEIKMM
jgi:small subunit ribosomal protein S10